MPASVEAQLTNVEFIDYLKPKIILNKITKITTKLDDEQEYTL